MQKKLVFFLVVFFLAPAGVYSFQLGSKNYEKDARLLAGRVEKIKLDFLESCQSQSVMFAKSCQLKIDNFHQCMAKNKDRPLLAGNFEFDLQNCSSKYLITNDQTKSN